MVLRAYLLLVEDFLQAEPLKYQSVPPPQQHPVGVLQCASGCGMRAGSAEAYRGVSAGAPFQGSTVRGTGMQLRVVENRGCIHMHNNVGTHLKNCKARCGPYTTSVTISQLFREYGLPRADPWDVRAGLG